MAAKSEVIGLYIHIPKTGGTSLKSVLDKFPNNVLTENSDIYRRSPLFYNEFLSVVNFKLSRTENTKNVLGENLFNSLWKVAIVRNPWDRYVSNWKWLTRKEKTYPKKGWKSRGWTGEDGRVSFDDFVKQMDWCYKNAPIHQYQHDKWHIRNQIEHIIDHKTGKIMVDHVGRFERLDEEFKFICEKIGIDANLPHLNHSGHYSGDVVRHDPIKIHYSNYYNQELIDIVAERCKQDIETFGYDYENLC